MVKKLIFCLVLFLFISVSILLINSVYPSVVEEMQVLQTDENSAIATSINDRETFTYDVQLASILDNADVKYDIYDLTELKGDTIPVIIKYGNVDIENPLPKKDLDAITRKLERVITSSGGNTRIKYGRLPFISVDIPKNKISEFSNLVKGEVPGSTVSIVEQFQILLDESVPKIKAPPVWQSGKDGTGIKIAVIDTGIDYTHSGLGGCLGAGCKVMMGKDFVNGDNDPMDDNGHGTHVAGIVAGTGGMYSGVAPGSSLFSAKVCSGDGSCPVDYIIAGIEWSVDPDNNPSTDDGVDIISISLGRGARSTNLENTTRWAINHGVIVVTAAGNSGPSGETRCRLGDDLGRVTSVCSPGVVEEAITVGATTKNDELSGSSSRGPNENLTVKPDIIAPGIDICSARATGTTLGSLVCDNNNYISLGGTSMAAPHVAGTAALVLQAHPSWTPNMVKSALVNNGKDLGLTVYEQGGGRLDAENAVNTPIIIDRPVINIGLVTPDTPDISTNFKIKNIGSVNQGIRIIADPLKNVVDQTIYNYGTTFSDFCLQSGNENTTALTINVAPLNIGYYSGFLRIDAFPNCDFGSTPKRLNIPIGFAKTREITVQFLNYPGSHSVRVRYSNNWFDPVPELKFYPMLGQFDVTDLSLYNNFLEHTYSIKGHDITASSETTLIFDGNNAVDVVSNVNSILETNDMSAYTFNTILRANNFKRGWGSTDLSNDDKFTGWSVAVNTNDPIFSDYKLDVEFLAKKRGVSYYDNTNLMATPIGFSYPFSDLTDNIENSELSSTEINITNPFIYTNPLQLYFGIASYSTEGGTSAFRDVGDTQVSGMSIPKQISFTFRNSPYCGMCNYLIVSRLTGSITDTDAREFLFNTGGYPG